MSLPGKYLTTTQAAPNSPAALLQAANRCYQAGDGIRAEAYYRQMLEIDPDCGEAWYRLGLLAWQQHKLADAHSFLDRCLTVSPDHVLAAKSLGGVLVQLGQPARAIGAFRHALSLKADDAESHNNLGALLGEIGQFDEALAEINYATKLQPAYARAYHNLGVTYEKQSRYEEAIANYNRAISLQPDYLLSYYNLAMLLKSQGEYRDALAIFNRALAVGQEYVEAYTGMGLIYVDLEQYDQAIDCFETALRYDPAHLPARYHYAVLLARLGQVEAAIKNYAQLLKLDATHLAATINLGTLYVLQNKFCEAERCFRRAVEIDPTQAPSYYNLAIALRRQGQIEAAMFNYQRALSLSPDNILWQIEAATYGPDLMVNEQAIEQWRLYLTAVLNNYLPGCISLEANLAALNGGGAHPRFELVYHGRNNKSFKEKYAGLFAFNSPQPHPESRPRRQQKQRYRVGFLVTKRHERVFNDFLSGVINNLDGLQFEVFVLCHRASVSLIKPNITASDVKIIDFAEDIERAVKKIKELGLDLIYYWEVGTDPANYFLPFFRLAPVQCTSWGTPETTGIRELDYFLSSALFEPENAEDYYSEQLLQLKSLGLFYYRPSTAGLTRTRLEFGLDSNESNEHLYFCTQNLLKYHPQFDWLLAEILRRDPQGKILVKAKQQHLNDAVRQRWQTRLPDVANRIEFVPYQNYDNYLNLMKVVDVLLDTIHYSGGTTSYEAIAVGTPVVTWPGEFMRGRMTYGCYQKIGVLDTVTWSAEAYVAKAVKLATDRAYQASIRQKILDASDNLFEDMTVVQELEQFFVWAIEKARKETENG